MADAVIKVTEVNTPRTRHFYAELLFKGRSFRVPNLDKPWPAADWPTYREALGAASDYRKTWVPPSELTIKDMDRRANEVAR